MTGGTLAARDSGEGDPLEDIRHTRRITAVIGGGVLYRPERLMRKFQ